MSDLAHPLVEDITFLHWGFGKEVAAMTRPIPFYFCRYEFKIGDEVLDYQGQLQALSELQGQYFQHERSRKGERFLDSVVMRPRSTDVDGVKAIAWSVGKKIGQRLTVEYDEEADRMQFATIDDTGIHYTDFVAIPSLGVMAVDDRTGSPHLGGKPAIGRFRSIFRHIEFGDVKVELTTTSADVDKALKTWGLQEFAFVVRPYNPHPPGDLSRRLSEQFVKDNIGTLRGKARPFEGQTMRPADDGQIAAVRELADDGYGQYAVKGVTADGHVAQIKQPQFDEQREKNRKRQAQPRELRVIIEHDGDGEDIIVENIINALRNFYG
jgi:hypothetical protein